jgi:hypothetical protein
LHFLRSAPKQCRHKSKSKENNRELPGTEHGKRPRWGVGPVG